MKKILLLLAVLGLAGASSAAAPTPEIALRVNGHSPLQKPLELWRGEPVLLEVQLWQPDRKATAPLVLAPPSGNWTDRVKVTVTGPGRADAWAFAIVNPPPGGSLTLQPSALTTLVLRLPPASAAALPPGDYRLDARLDLPDGRGWKGIRRSVHFPVRVIEPPANATGAALGSRQLLRVRDALLVKDLARAEKAANEMLQADAKRPEGLVAFALVSEAKGQLRLAALAAELAVGRAGTTEGGAATEYLDLARRLRALAPVDSGTADPAQVAADDAQSAAAASHPVKTPKPSPTPATTTASAKPAPPVPAAKPIVLPGEPDYTRDPNGQWAATAEASSQYGTGRYSASQATGVPNASSCGDHWETWTSKTMDGGEEWLMLHYATPVHATEVRVRQSYNPGAIVKVEVLDAAGQAVTVWSGHDTTKYDKNQVGWFVAKFAATVKPVSSVRLTLDTASVKGWNAIDAVQLVGTR